MAETEKITINVDVVDLGKIDLLVDQGFYSTRTDLIKTAIRNEIARHSQIVEDYAVKKSFVFGISKLTKQDLEKIVANGAKLQLKVIGLLMIDEEVDQALAKQAIESVTVHGSFKARAEIKQLF